MNSTRSAELHKSLRNGLIILFAFLFGVTTGLVGVAPGFLAAILLIYMLGLTPSHSKSLVTVLILAAAVPAILVYSGSGEVHWRAAIEAAIGSIVGAMLSAWIFRRRYVDVARKILAVALIAAGIALISVVSHHAGPMPEGFNVTLGAAFAVGLAAGFLGSVSSLATGKLLVPMLVLILSVPQRTAQALALASIIPASIPLAYSHYAVGGVDRAGLVEYSIAAALGGVIGAAVAMQITVPALVVVFGVFLIVTAAAVLAVKSTV